jgi:hypothetical protein
MTQPVGSNSSLNYTPYDPDEELCRSEGTGGPNGGAEGAGGVSTAPQPTQADRDCTAEVMSAIGTCGGAYLAGKLSPLAGLFGLFGCGAAVKQLDECLSQPETKAQGQ